MALVYELVDSLERAVLPRHVPMTVVAQDPSLRDLEGRLVRARVRVPAGHLEPGPRGARFHVVDYDVSTGRFHPPAPAGPGWDYHDRFAAAPDEVLLADPHFHAQNAYAIAARTLAAFEGALGRRLAWSFPGHQLYLVPHAFAEANAYYSGDDRAILFGSFPGPDGAPVHTCLSHDIVAHEATHAVLDGLRRRFAEPGLPDQAAFHEAFADIVALLSVFSVPAVVAELLGPADAEGRIAAGQVGEEALAATALFKLAEELGEATSGERGQALRRSVALAPSEAWKEDPAFEEPHRRGEVLVAAVMRTLISMWRARLAALIADERLDRARAAEEGAKAAAHLLGMAIRAIDYCPPVEFEFADFIDAVLVSDAVVAPDDEQGYRDALRGAFAAYGIEPPAGRIIDLSAEGSPVYDHLNMVALRSLRDEAFRFIWENAPLLRIDRAFHVRVEDVEPAVRVGPDGLVVQETLVDYVQSLEGPAEELRRLSGEALVLPGGLAPSTPLQLWGGGAIVFDQFGRAKYHQAKPLDDWERQSRRLAHLVRAGLRDTRGRVGFSAGTPRGQRFAEFHVAHQRAGEAW